MNNFIINSQINNKYLYRLVIVDIDSIIIMLFHLVQEFHVIHDYISRVCLEFGKLYDFHHKIRQTSVK